MAEAESITDYLKRRLREAGASKFDEIAEEAGVTASFIRKFVYGSRENPRVQTIQPLLDYFAAVDQGAPTQHDHAKSAKKATKRRNPDRSNGHKER
jgi:transcriptional regulator with XRE-family HTH domain